MEQAEAPAPGSAGATAPVTNFRQWLAQNPHGSYAEWLQSPEGRAQGQGNAPQPPPPQPFIIPPNQMRQLTQPRLPNLTPAEILRMPREQIEMLINLMQRSLVSDLVVLQNIARIRDEVDIPLDTQRQINFPLNFSPEQQPLNAQNFINMFQSIEAFTGTAWPLPQFLGNEQEVETQVETQVEMPTEDNLQNLTFSQIRLLPPDQIQFLSRDQIRSIAPQQMQYLTPTQLRSLPRLGQAELQWLTPEQIQFLSPDQLP